MPPRVNPFDGRQFNGTHRRQGKSQADKVPEYFSLNDYTAGLDPFTLARRIDAESSMYRWIEVVLGYGDLPDDCDYRLYETIHRPMCDRAENALPIRGREKRGYQKKILDLEPRGALKTNVLSAGSLLFYLIHDYDGRALISSHAHKASKEILSLVKWNMEFNLTFKQFYGDWAYYAKKFGIWRDDVIELAFRTKAYREPTIDTCGAEISKTGGHYGLIVVDDIQNRENSRSEVERENVRGRIQEYFPQLEPSGAMIVPGTRYHKLDVYGWIMERRKKALENDPDSLDFLFDITVKSAWNEDGSLYYPTRLNQRFLDQQQVELEDYLFAVWYKNEPIDDASKVFLKPEGKEREFDFIRDLVPYIQLPNGTRRSLYTTMAWDPKGRESTSKRVDSHGFTIVGNDSADIWWILEALELKLPLDELLERIAGMLRMYSVMKLSIETRGASMQGLWIDLLKPVLKRHGLDRIPIHEWSPGNQNSKDSLIRSLQPRFKQGRMWFRKGYCGPLIKQMDGFPQIVHDDVLDSLVHHRTVSRPASIDDIDPTTEGEEAFDLEDGNGEQESFGLPTVGMGTPDYTAA